MFGLGDIPSVIERALEQDVVAVIDWRCAGEVAARVCSRFIGIRAEFHPVGTSDGVVGEDAGEA